MYSEVCPRFLTHQGTKMEIKNHDPMTFELNIDGATRTILNERDLDLLIRALQICASHKLPDNMKANNYVC